MKVFFAGALVVITGIAACTQVAEPPVVYGTAVYDKHGNLVGYENEFGVVVPATNGVVVVNGVVVPASPTGQVRTRTQTQTQLTTQTTQQTQTRGGP
jgi:hypothetical protein